MPAGGGDVHTARSTGIEREALDQDALSRGSSVALAKNPAAPWKNVPKFSFHWTRPANGWSWMSRRYALEKPVAIPGVPLRFSMDVFMEDNVKNYPVTILLTFRDADGKEIRVEGAEVYWRGWRKWECFLPGFLNHGRIHSVAGGDERRAMEKAPFQFTGFIINLPPPKAIVHFPADAPDAGGFILVDNLRVETCD
jgi:hypothetical protein